MAHAQAVETVVADPGLQVEPDIGLVAAEPRPADALAVEPSVEPLADGQAADQVLTGLQAPPGLLDIRQWRLLVADLLQHGGDQRYALGVVGVGEAEQRVYVVEIGLGRLEGVVGRRG